MPLQRHEVPAESRQPIDLQEQIFDADLVQRSVDGFLQTPIGGVRLRVVALENQSTLSDLGKRIQSEAFL